MTLQDVLWYQMLSTNLTYIKPKEKFLIWKVLQMLRITLAPSV